jgi:hypothetical protein
MKETDPVGWATQTSRASSRPPSRRAEDMEQRSSAEFGGAEWLEEAVRDGLL